MECCETCKYSKLFNLKGKVQMFCRRFPPTVYIKDKDVVMAHIQTTGIESAFPKVDDSDWCGEYNEKTN